MFTLPNLPFPTNAMPSFSSAETFSYHHGKHHAAYVNKLNAAIEGTPLAEQSLEYIIQTAHIEKKSAIFNNAAQHWNHSFFWNSISPEGGGELTEALRELIVRDFGSVDEFRKKFTEFSTTLFGSGWVWLVQNADGILEILPMPNAGTPVTEQKTALLTLDVWEHAYYIDFRNDRAKYVDAFWGVVNWKHAAGLLK